MKNILQNFRFSINILENVWFSICFSLKNKKKQTEPKSLNTLSQYIYVVPFISPKPNTPFFSALSTILFFLFNDLLLFSSPLKHLLLEAPKTLFFLPCGSSCNFLSPFSLCNSLKSCLFLCPLSFYTSWRIIIVMEIQISWQLLLCPWSFHM